LAGSTGAEAYASGRPPLIEQKGEHAMLAAIVIPGIIVLILVIVLIVYLVRRV
jgi:hypothetical protein